MTSSSSAYYTPGQLIISLSRNCIANDYNYAGISFGECGIASGRITGVQGMEYSRSRRHNTAPEFYQPTPRRGLVTGGMNVSLGGKRLYQVDAVKICDKTAQIVSQNDVCDIELLSIDVDMCVNQISCLARDSGDCSTSR